MKTITQDVYDYRLRVVLVAVITTLLGLCICNAFAQTNTQTQFFDLRVGYIYTCSISDEESKVTLKSASAKLCVDELNMRSMHVGSNGKDVRCAIDTPTAYFEFKKQNDEPGKGRVACIIAMQDSSKPFDQPVPKIITPKAPVEKRDAKLHFY